nr:MAG TPA: hypothetical protein [Caudoviricetes sp.]
MAFAYTRRSINHLQLPIILLANSPRIFAQPISNRFPAQICGMLLIGGLGRKHHKKYPNSLLTLLPHQIEIYLFIK